MLQRCITDTSSCTAALSGGSFSMCPQDQFQLILDKILLFLPKRLFQIFQYRCFIQPFLGPLHQHFTSGSIQLFFCHTLDVRHCPADRAFPGEQASVLTIAGILPLKLSDCVKRPAKQICFHRFHKTSCADLHRFRFHLCIQTIKPAPFRYSGKCQVKASALFTDSLKKELLKCRISISTAGS